MLLYEAYKRLKAAQALRSLRMLALSMFGTMFVIMLPIYGQKNVVRLSTDPNASNHNVSIVIGFVGGRVRHDDTRHPEVQLADTLRRLDGSSVNAEVFENRHRERA